ncbi:MAG: FecR family protein [Synergistaceae bacterium]|nr:FecR family protein [Synergistaceae bacterium]
MEMNDKHSTGFFLIFLFVMIICLFCPFYQSQAAADNPVGHVENANAGFGATREDKRIDLTAGDGVFEFDILETDASGAATIRFVDGSVLEMRGETRLNVKEVVFSEDRNRFNVGVINGTARIITGMIVKRNPRGFKITTPTSTIGIRGTTLSFIVRENVESVTVDDISEGSVVTYVNRLTGETFTMTKAGDSITATGMTENAPSIETSGEGLLHGERDTKGNDMSGLGDNPRAPNPSGGRGSGSGNGGSGSSRGRGGDCCGDNGSPEK